MNKATLLSVGSIFLLTACGKTLDGTYADASGIVQYKFSGRKVTVTTMGIESELDYSVDGDKIKIAAGNGQNLIMTISANGTIQGITGPLRKIN